MSVLEIIAAILLILACIFIVLVVLMQDSKQGMSQTISGASADNYFQKNSGRTKEARLAKLTRTAAIIVFVVALLVNLITIYGWGKSDGSSTPAATSTTTTTAAPEAEGDGEGSGTEGSAAEEDGAEGSEATGSES
ncbi:MAG: preprotein translocase subunit SecG [Oscillospiraceae bacterium]|nr:preprotein translocase subunit SecG [Oscillospiraceae bacterium]